MIRSGLDAAARAAKRRPDQVPAHHPRRPTEVPVVLLDDVLTSGSTSLAAIKGVGGRGHRDGRGVLTLATAAPWRSEANTR